jgi:two-component system, NarL family, sensor histidine kinase EvgS
LALINNKNVATRVLIVDDQPITRALLSRAVSARGLAVDSANNGQEALSMWINERYPLVITDCHMPVKDGYALSQDIRQFEQTKQLKQLKQTTIIAWSADIDKDDQDKCLKAGMNNFLKKPINFDQLNHLLSTFTKQSSEETTIKDDVKALKQDYQSPIDYTILNQIVPDPSKQFKVINDLLNYINKDYPSLQQYAETQNLNELKNSAHRLKGACKMVGANDIANVFATIESEVLDISLSDIELLLNKLGGATNQLELFLKKNEIPNKVEH